MKKTPVVVIIIGCLLLFANVSVAGSAATISRALCKDSRDLVKSTIEQPDLDQQLAEDNFSITPEEGKDVALQQSEESVSEEVEEGKTVEKSANQGTFHGHQVTLKIANAGGPYSGQKDAAITFDGSSCFYVPGSTYVWDFGDDNDRAHGYGLHPTHVYSRDGVYYATLTVTKSSGDTYLDIAPVYIGQDNNHLIPLGGCSYEAETGEQITFDASQSMSTDPDAYPLKYRWDFGDGEDYTSWSTDPIITHSYETERVYKVKLEVKDRYGNTRCDILHADIGGSFSDIRNFFINGDSIFDDILSMLFDDWEGGIFFCQWLDVKIYTKYNDIEKYTTIYSFDDARSKKIDVNNDGIDDVHIGDVTFFKLLSDSPRASPFNSNIESYQFETTFSNIRILSSGAISFNDNFTICLQFTFPPIIADNYEIFGLAEPTVKIGYHMDAEKEKPYQQISVTHIFRPFLLAKLGIMNNGNSQQNNMVPNGQQNIMIVQQSAQASVEPIARTTGTGNTGSTTTMATSPSMNMQMNAQQQNPMVPLENSGIYPEHGVTIDGINGETISLIGIVENNDYTTTLEIKFESIFTPFTLTHRRGDTCRDVDLSGSDSSAITFSITRENADGSATLGMLINPIDYLGFHLDIGRENDERQVTFNIDNPPENVILFAETEDSQGQQDGRYFYMKHIPEMIELRWLPRLDNGYIALDIDQGPSNFEVGLCDDLEEPLTKLYLTDLPTTLELGWTISPDEPREISISSNTAGLTLYAEVTDAAQENQNIEFYATSTENFEISIQWSLQQGWFKLLRSVTEIDFGFSLQQENLLLDITGTYATGSEDGLTFTFSNFLEQGSIEVGSNRTIDLTVDVVNLETDASLHTGVIFNTEGNVNMQWDQSTIITIDGDGSIGVYNFNLTCAACSITVDDITLADSGHFGIELEEDRQLQLSGNGQLTVSNFSGDFTYWSGSISSASTVGNLDILLKPMDKYCKIESSHFLALAGFDIEYAGPEQEYDLDFEIDYFSMAYGGTTWLDFNSDIPKVNVNGGGAVDVDNLYFSIGSGSANAIEVAIPSAHLYREGTIYAEWNEDYLFVDATVDFDWDITIETLNYGNWEARGSIEGSLSMDAAWEDGSGSIEFVIDEPGLAHNFEIIHDDLTLNLGTFFFEPGIITFEWQREMFPNNGHFNILNNGINGNLTLCKITYPPSEFELELGNITVDSGNFHMDWSRATNKKTLHIDNSMTINIDLIKVTWSGKTTALNMGILSTGEFKFMWDTLNKKITVNNGISGLGASCYYEDADRKLSVTFTNLEDDYTKTTTLKWYEEQNGGISGVYLDTDDAPLADWVQFESIKGDTGRRITLAGLQADNFYIKKVDNKLEWGGKLYLANHLIFSKLINDEWKDLDVQWDIQDDEKMIKFESEFDLTLNILSADILGFTINTDVDLTDYLEIRWKLETGSKLFYLDTNGDTIANIVFTIVHDTGLGIQVIGGGVQAEGFQVSWTLWPPQEANVSVSGYIDYESIGIYASLGGDWYKVWPWGGGPTEKRG